MANGDRPAGFKPFGKALRVSPYVAGEAIYPGDCVRMQADGKLDVAAASESLLGVAASYAAADGDEVLVWDDPNQMFIGQCDGSDVDAQTDIGLNYNLVATAGNTTYRTSRQEIDSDSQATDSNLPFRSHYIETRPDNALGAQVELVVSINNHQLQKSSEGL